MHGGLEYYLCPSYLNIFTMFYRKETFPGDLFIACVTLAILPSVSLLSSSGTSTLTSSMGISCKNHRFGKRFWIPFLLTNLNQQTLDIFFYNICQTHALATSLCNHNSGVSKDHIQNYENIMVYLKPGTKLQERY